jgi:hypothetical protein
MKARPNSGSAKWPASFLPPLSKGGLWQHPARLHYRALYDVAQCTRRASRHTAPTDLPSHFAMAMRSHFVTASGQSAQQPPFSRSISISSQLSLEPTNFGGEHRLSFASLRLASRRTLFPLARACHKIGFIRNGTDSRTLPNPSAAIACFTCAVNSRMITRRADFATRVVPALRCSCTPAARCLCVEQTALARRLNFSRSIFTSEACALVYLPITPSFPLQPLQLPATQLPAMLAKIAFAPSLFAHNREPS